MFVLRTKAGLVLAVLLWVGGLLLPPTASAQATVSVSFTTTNSTPLNLGYAGFTTELLGKGIDYGDTNMQRFANMLSPGWLLYPAGETGDAYSWSNGLTDSNWVNELTASNDTAVANLAGNTYYDLIGKGGVWLTNFAKLAANVGGAKIIVCVNGFTDSAASAGAEAAYCKSNHISVAVWELCNEPYLFQGATNFFTNGTDYANKMLPYRNAIKAADSNAVVAVFFSDPGRTGMSWDNALAKYSPQYWDAVVYHHYPELPTGLSFSNLMALDNSVLYSNTTLYVTNVLMTDDTNADATFLVTELAPALGDNDGTQNLPTSSLYGGIYVSEYLMRLSTIPQFTFAGSFQLVNHSGIDATNYFDYAVAKAGTNNYVTNTVGLPFGYFLSAQVTAEAVAYWALNRSRAVFPTSVSANGPTVPMDTNGLTTMPALYAQAYQGDNGQRYILITNKGATNVPVQISQDNLPLTNQLLETFVTGTDPSTVNTNPPAANNITFQTNTVFSPVTIPEYSVVRLEWTVFTVTNPVLSVTAANSSQTLNWVGLTNVTYNVQATTNLPASWYTLGRVTNSQVNFSFTNVNTAPNQFYRLVVP